jgi:uncharacterized LabA/DUF88 family protein
MEIISVSLVFPSRSYPARTMIFIDGGYLRRWIEEKCNMKTWDFPFGAFSTYITRKALGSTDNAILIRSYYYDGIVESTDVEHLDQKNLFKHINNGYPNYEVRLGRLVRDGKGNLRQKGVDVLMAIDMIEKANTDQYDLAIVIAGDLDHLEAIQAVKTKGKQVYGVYFEKRIADELFDNFDNHLKFESQETEIFLKYAEETDSTYKEQEEKK